MNREESKKKNKGKLGRKRIKRTFDETSIGHFLKHEAPLEYQLIVNSCGAFAAPSPNIIETVSYGSNNPLFRKTKFRRALIKYRKYGLYSGRPIKSTANTELYYIKIRKAIK
jgi:hypothetical protein